MNAQTTKCDAVGVEPGTVTDLGSYAEHLAFYEDGEELERKELPSGPPMPSPIRNSPPWRTDHHEASFGPRRARLSRSVVFQSEKRA